MKFNLNSGRVATLAVLAMIAMVAIGGISGVVAAATVAQGDAPVTNTNSDWQDDGSSTVVDFNASENQNSTVQFEINSSVTTTETAIAIDGPRGNEHVNLTNASSVHSVVATNNADGNDVHQFNISHDRLEEVPMEAGANVTINVTLTHEWENSSGSIKSNSSTFGVTLDNTMERSVIYLDGDSPAMESQTNEEPTSVGGFNVPFTGEQNTKISDTRKIDGSNTTVYMYVANDTAASQFDSQFGDASAGKWVDGSTAKIGSEGVKMYPSELPNPLSDMSENAAVTYDTSGDTPVLVMELGDHYDGETSIDVEAQSDPGFRERLSTYGALELLGFGGGMLTMSGGLLVVGRRRSLWSN